jgi:hypothetical protein
VTRALLEAIDYNRRGAITAVDSFCDFDSARPPHIAGLEGRVDVITSEERSFVASCPDNWWDLLVSDADHNHSGEWLSETLRIVKPGGWLFFHDTNAPNYATLYEIPERLRRRGYLVTHFTESSRSDERCNRGLLMAQKPLAQLAD